MTVHAGGRRRFAMTLLCSLVILPTLLCSIGTARAAPSAPPAPSAPLSAVAVPTSGRVGQTIRVDGSGWPASAQVQLVTCGALAITGSASCDMAAAFTVVADGAGRFETSVQLSKPPVPCPCVVQVSAIQGGKLVNIPVQLAGVPTAPLPKVKLVPSAPPLQVISAELTGWGGWGALFGATRHNQLVVTVRNTSGSVVAKSPLYLSDTSGAAKSDHPAATIGPFRPHSVQSFRVPVRLDAGVGGAYLLHGTLAGGPGFTVSTHAYPWALYALAVVLIAVVWRLLSWWLRRRKRDGRRYRNGGPESVKRRSASPGRQPAGAAVRAEARSESA